ncbi:MAG: metal ABC transporter permease [Thermostichales cyanobacterium SZTDM-1c_bins_54]
MALINWQPLLELLGYPFMQRALLGGMLIGALAGGVGSLAVVRQFSFFSHTVSHAALLGIVLSAALGWDPTLTLLPFTVLFGLGVLLLVRMTGLWRDTVLNVTFSGSLALAVIGLSQLPGYRGGLSGVLFGDILAIQERDIGLSWLVLMGVGVLLLLSLRPQSLMVLHPEMARARGIPIGVYEVGFVVVLSVLVALATRVVGVLLVNAFLVIPAAIARLLSCRFGQFMALASLVGAGSAVVGVLVAGLTNWPAGPSVVVVQMGVFLLVAVWRHFLEKRMLPNQSR